MSAVVTKRPKTIPFAEISLLRRPVSETHHLVPNQGSWTEAEYFRLDEDCLLEFTDGTIEVLPMANPRHQRIVLFLYRLLYEDVMSRGLGDVIVAPMPVRIGSKKLREPDIAFLSDEHSDLEEAECWAGADLVVEVVSKGDPKRALVQKRKEYALAGISEYWIVQQGIRRAGVELEGSVVPRTEIPAWRHRDLSAIGGF
jgi:Uma2 family endonuclease